MIDDYVMKSDADVVLLGGDFNAGPDMTDGETLSISTKVSNKLNTFIIC